MRTAVLYYISYSAGGARALGAIGSGLNMLLTAPEKLGRHPNLCWERACSGTAVVALAMACVRARDCWRTMTAQRPVQTKKSCQPAT